MWTRQKKKRRTGALIVPVISSAIIAYFSFHAYQGDYGIYSKYRLESRVSELQQELAGLQQERQALEERVRHLNDGSIERDMLDELARRALNLSMPDEITVMRPRAGG
jgi:cell division protein FtsB